MTNPILYYRVNPKNNRAYWCPTKSMRRVGFNLVALGFDGPEARDEAQKWNARWHEALKERGPRAMPRDGRDPPGRSFVYFIQVDDRVKIGVSTRPFTRLKSISGSAHGVMQAVVLVRGTREDEGRMHRRFARYRTNGEWFVASPALQRVMRACVAAGRVIYDDDESEEGTTRPDFLNRRGSRIFESHSQEGGLSD